MSPRRRSGDVEHPYPPHRCRGKRGNVDHDDITWTGPAGEFKYRAAAVIRDGDRILVCAVEHIDGWFLPGGRVHFGESSAQALTRELREELAADVTVTGPPFLITEGIRDQDGVLHQEVSCYYALGHHVLPGPVTDRGGHRFRWLRLADLDSANFLPPEIAAHLADEPTGTRHVVFDRRTPR